MYQCSNKQTKSIIYLILSSKIFVIVVISSNEYFLCAIRIRLGIYHTVLYELEISLWLGGWICCTPTVRPGGFFCYFSMFCGIFMKLCIWTTDFSMDCLQTSLLIFSELKLINSLLFPLKASENHRFSDDFRGNRCHLICLNSLNIRSEVWRRSLRKHSKIKMGLQFLHKK